MRVKYRKYPVMLRVIFFVSVFCFEAHSQTTPIKNDPSVNEQENLAVFQQWSKWSSPGSIPAATFIGFATEAHEKRDKQINEITSLGQWQHRQRYVKETLRNVFSRSFVSGPLNAKVTGVIKMKGYRIEKIVFESVPGYYVTGCVYVPEKIKGKIPAVLNLMGHDQEAFRAELYQLINVNLALKGIMVFTIDPPGQGEMVQYYDSSSKSSSIGYSVIEHCYFANQSFLLGVSPAVHFVRDGMRAIDYLTSRKDVDANRIGVTGFSGGGTITSFLSAVDERVKVSVPSSWSTASRRQIETKGTQDGESVLLNSLTQGITFEDLVEVRAPKPTMMTFASRDQYLSVQGAREIFSEAKKIYEAYGKPGELQLFEDDSKHWLTLSIRKAMYSFFTLKFDLKVDATEVPAEILSLKDLTVTPTGQVSSSYNSKLIFDLNNDLAKDIVTRVNKSRSNNANHLEEVLTHAKKLSAYNDSDADRYTVFFNGRYQRNNYSVSKIALERVGKSPVPILLFTPHHTSSPKPAIIYLNPLGKDVQAGVGGEIEKLVSKGFVVAAVDVFGMGETENKILRPLCVGYGSVLTGRSATGIQAAELSTVANFLTGHPQVNKQRIGGMAIGQLAFPLLHAAAFDSTIRNIVLIDCPLSYASLAMNRKYKISNRPHDQHSGNDPAENDFSWGIAGVVSAYDIADLAATIAPRKILLAGARDHLFQPAAHQLIEKEMQYPLSVYAEGGVPAHFKRIETNKVDGQINWVFE